MKNKRLTKYLAARKLTRANALKQKTNVDKKTNQDFPGYPHATASEKVITPETKTEKKTARVDTTDGEKMLTTKAKKKTKTNEEQSDGSASAFEGTENVSE
jgi:hypothetical protein